ncbi:dynamin family protein [Acetobacterium malicum]|uniref:dynamin family protein n=1 Tax=Acetobacterium malicum TaxID=52692 RepID=UPI00164CA8BC|nr:dynamin family protein [Acetobacterium malicum]
MGEELAEVHLKTGQSQTVALDQLVEYIAEQQNPNNQKGISFVNLFLPDDFLKDGITLVDTPGVGSIHQNNTGGDNFTCNRIFKNIAISGIIWEDQCLK